MAGSRHRRRTGRFAALAPRRLAQCGVSNDTVWHPGLEPDRRLHHGAVHGVFRPQRRRAAGTATGGDHRLSWRTDHLFHVLGRNLGVAAAPGLSVVRRHHRRARGRLGAADDSRRILCAAAVRFQGIGIKATVLRLYMHESRRFHGMLLYEWLLQHARRLGIHGGSAFRAVAGYGRHGVMHEANFFELAGELPVVTEFIVSDADAERILALVRKENIDLLSVCWRGEFSPPSARVAAGSAAAPATPSASPGGTS